MFMQQTGHSTKFGGPEHGNFRNLLQPSRECITTHPIRLSTVKTKMAYLTAAVRELLENTAQKALSTELPESTLTVSQVGNKANSAIYCEESMNLLAGDRGDTANKEEAKSSASGSIPLPVPPTSCSRPNIIREWRWELITWLLSTFAVWSIFGILLIFKDKSLDTWKSKVQITAVVAVFSQLAQSALIVSVSACIGQSKWTLIRQKQPAIEIERHQEASQGPEGALKLLVLGLWRPKARRILSTQS
jgi:hypothetical protein